MPTKKRVRKKRDIREAGLYRAYEPISDEEKKEDNKREVEENMLGHVTEVGDEILIWVEEE